MDSIKDGAQLKQIYGPCETFHRIYNPRWTPALFRFDLLLPTPSVSIEVSIWANVNPRISTFGVAVRLQLAKVIYGVNLEIYCASRSTITVPHFISIIYIRYIRFIRFIIFVIFIISIISIISLLSFIYLLYIIYYLYVLTIIS